MVWCTHCKRNITSDTFDGKICCSLCGKVLDEDIYSEEPGFVKDASGQGRLSGNFVSSIQNELTASRQRTLDEADYGIKSIMYALGIDGGESISKPSVNLYQIAVERNFTKGRRKREWVQASCLYIICREKKKPYFLIEFAEHLRTSVYVLGGVFLKLCELLSLLENPIIQNPVDPSLFIHKYTYRLFDELKEDVSSLALRFLASMKRNWMQTGRKPSALCGAALRASALAHGFKCSKSKISQIVNVSEATLTKRLIEFANTESGGLTIDEFKMKEDEQDKEDRLITSRNTGSKASKINELLCMHKGDRRAVLFDHGLCKKCYEDFMKLSGGLSGGSDPPAFQRAEMGRLKEKKVASKRPNNSESSATEQHRITKDSYKDTIHKADDTSEESEGLSDLDDDIEWDVFLLTEEHQKLYKIVWERMNKEYLEEQAAKEAARTDYLPYLPECSGDVEAAKRLAEEATAKSKKEKQEKRAADKKNVVPAKTTSEAVKRMLDKKGQSSKINLEKLKELFGEDQESQGNPKKSRTEKEPYHDEYYHRSNSKDSEVEDPNMEEYNYEGNVGEYSFDDDVGDYNYDDYNGDY